MRFRIPQFLDIEDKIFGPFTVKQFSYSLGGVAFIYIFWKLIPIKIISIIFILIFSGTFFALAFVKINERPFADILEAAYKYLINNKTYIWRRPETSVKDFLEKGVDTKRKALPIIVKKELSVEDKMKNITKGLNLLSTSNKNTANLNLREQLLKRKREIKI